MRESRTLLVGVLRIVATLLTLSPVIGLLVTLCGMMVAFQTLAGPGVHTTAAVAGPVSAAITATLLGLPALSHRRLPPMVYCKQNRDFPVLGAAGSVCGEHRFLY